MDKTTYQKCLKDDIRKRRPLPRCKVCGRDGSIVLDKYIIFTKADSKRTVLICKNCFIKIKKNGELIE
jgi:hypothetical protein